MYRPLPSRTSRVRPRCRPALAALVLGLAVTTFDGRLPAQQPQPYSRVARTIELASMDIERPVALAFSPRAESLIVVDVGGPAGLATFQLVHQGNEVRYREDLGAAFDATAAIAFDAVTDQLLILQAGSGQLLRYGGGGSGVPQQRVSSTLDVRAWGLLSTAGMATDPATGRLFILETAPERILAVSPDGRMSQIRLAGRRLGPLSGLAFDPTTRSLHVLNRTGRVLHELTETGALVGSRDLAALGLVDPVALTAGASGDATDDPATTNLYVLDAGASAGGWPSGDLLAPAADGGARVVELSLGQPIQPMTPSVAATLVRTIHANQFNPPSPDTAGIAYDTARDRLLMSDSEVNEMPIYAGVNVFETTRAGVVIATWTTLPKTDEPTGVAYNPINRHWFISDDNQKEVFEYAPGPDGVVGTNDDVITQFDTLVFGSNDPEGVAYRASPATLFIVDGLNAEVYLVQPGPNGKFDGIGVDDIVTSFDTLAHGFTDPEGIEYDPVTGHLFIVGRPTTLIGEYTTGGTLLRTIDISGVKAVAPAGLAMGPGSIDPTARNLYMAARGKDNNDVPDENDGKVYELAFPTLTSGNTAPVVSAGPDLAITLPAVAVLDGTIADDGLPNPPGVTTASWTQVSGPGSATFANAAAVDTTASFTSAGTYVLRLTANDGELQSSDDVTVTVAPATGVTTVEVRITQSPDDAEESATGSVTITSSDIDLVETNTTVQKVGLRFPGMTIPRASPIVAAWVQFKADESQSGPTSLQIRAQASDNAPTFTTAKNNVSSRPTTAAVANWNPAAWSRGAAGAAQRTVDLSAVIQEVVNRGGWTSGNAIALIVTGSGMRVAASVNGEAAGAALLHVEYTTGNAPPTVDAGPDRTITLPATAFLDGTIVDDGRPNPPGVTTASWSQVSGPGTALFTAPNAEDTSVSFSSPGTYVLRLTANDGAAQASDDVIVTVNAAGGPQVLEVRITAGSDDAEESATGSVTITSSDIDLVETNTTVQKVGLRFPGLTIPRASQIVAAWVQFQADESQSVPTSLQIRAQASDNAPTFTTAKFNVSSRPTTTAVANWSPPAWSRGAAGAAQRTVDLSGVIGEIVNRGGWTSGNAIALIVTGSGMRVAVSANTDPAAAALLHIEYIP